MTVKHVKPNHKIRTKYNARDYNIYTGIPIPDNKNHQTILGMKKNRWLRCSTITSRQIRLLLKIVS
jgi:hypothetical protein